MILPSRSLSLITYELLSDDEELIESKHFCGLYELRVKFILKLLPVMFRQPDNFPLWFRCDLHFRAIAYGPT